MNGIRHPLSLATIAILLAAGTSHADTRGLSCGLRFHSSQLGSLERAADDVPQSVFIDETGGGGGLWLGWGFDDSFSLRLSVDGAAHETTDPAIEVGYGSVTLEALYLFRNPDHLRPFVVGGIGGFGLLSRDDQYDYGTAGGGLVTGGGLYYFFGETFALEFSGRLEFVNWEEKVASRIDDGDSQNVTTPVESEGIAGKLTFGVSTWF